MSGRSKIDFTDPSILDDITGWIASGYTEASIAKSLGYSITYFSDLKKKYPELSEAIKKGQQDVDQLVLNEFWHMMFNREHPKQFSALVFYAKCKLGWMEKSQFAQQGTPSTTGLTFGLIEGNDDSSD